MTISFFLVPPYGDSLFEFITLLNLDILKEYLEL